MVSPFPFTIRATLEAIYNKSSFQLLLNLRQISYISKGGAITEGAFQK